MAKKISKVLALFLAIMVFMTVLTACGTGSNPTQNDSASQQSLQTTAAVKSNETDDISSRPWSEFNGDTSELPTWTGKQLKLNYWFGEGAGGMAKKKSEGDVITPEITRVTGVAIDLDNSFDNGGQSYDVKLSMLSAANDWPSMVISPQDDKLEKAGKFVDLTDLYAQYCPTASKKYDTKYFIDFGMKESKGKLWCLPYAAYQSLYMNTDIDPSVDKNRYGKVFNAPPDAKGYIWVRDDILKKLYPNAKSQKEIEDMYMQKGSFTKEDILDVPINSYNDFIQFLYNIKSLNIMEGNKPVSPFFTYVGTDNWPLMAALFQSLLGFGDSTYYTYFDKQSQKIEYMFKQPEFIQAVKDMNKLVRDGVASKESLIDSNAIWQEKMNNGMYAVSYAWLKPDNSLLEKQDKPYRYRKVYLNIEPKTDKYPRYKGPEGTRFGLYLFKDSVREEDLPQILRWYDYLVSDASEKMHAWGPASAGLFEEKDGKRVFKDKELEEYMVYNKPSDKGLYYNLPSITGDFSSYPTGGLMVSYIINNMSKYHPTVIYDKQPNVAETDAAFSIGYFEPARLSLEVMYGWVWCLTDVPGIKQGFGDGKKSFEDLLTKTLTASSDAEFDKFYEAFLKNAEKIGFTEESLAAADKLFKDKSIVRGVNYLDNLK